MEQYIPKSVLVAEIEELISNGKFKCQQSQENNDQVSYVAWSEHIATCGKILSLINTLEVKEVDTEQLNKLLNWWKEVTSDYSAYKVKEVDFEKELNKEWNKCEPVDEGMGLEIASIEHEQFDNIAKHFFELGLKTQKGE